MRYYPCSLGDWLRRPRALEPTGVGSELPSIAEALCGVTTGSAFLGAFTSEFAWAGEREDSPSSSFLNR